MIDTATLAGVLAASGALAAAGAVLAYRFGLARGKERGLEDPTSGLASRDGARTFLDGAVAVAAGSGQDRSRAPRAPADDRGPVSVAFFQVHHTRDRDPDSARSKTRLAGEALAGVLGNRTPPSALSARWSEATFLTVLPGRDRQGVVEFSEQVRDELHDQELPWGTVALSAGLAVFDPTMSSAEVLLAAADQALALARDNGVDEYVVAGDGDGGRTWSRAVEHGSPPPRAVRLEGALPSLSSHEVHVLLVDDDDAVRDALLRMLERLGYHVTATTDAGAALRVMREQGHRLDLVVTDVILPDRNGFALAEELLRYRPDLPILYVSGHLYGEISWSGVPGETTDFLEKPVEMKELAVKVEGLLRHVRAPTATHR